MKIHPDQAGADLCQTSMDLLKDECSRLLSAHGARQIAYPDCSAPIADSDGDILDVVFFGSFAKRFLETGNWFGKSFRLWVLCQSARDVLCQLLGVPRESVGVLPRDRLFPPSAHPRALPRRDEPMTLVFSGRLSPTKNLDCLIHAVSALQIRFGLPVRLALCGDFDDQPHPDRGQRERESYREKISNLIRSLRWTNEPRFYPKVAPTLWHAQGFENPVYVSLSTFVCEDFGVALAQARAQGWPAILSDWGAHLDVSGVGVAKVHPAYIAHSHEPPQVVRLKGESLAAEIAGRLGTDPAASAPITELTFPAPLAAAELDAIRRRFLANQGPEAHAIYRDGLEAFADTATGARFFARYRLVFSAPFAASPELILINDLHASGEPNLRSAEAITEKIVRSAPEGAVLVSTRELTEPVWLTILSRARSAAIPFYSDHLYPLVDLLLNRLEFQAPLSIYAPASAKNLDRLRGLLRTGDAIHES